MEVTGLPELPWWKKTAVYQIYPRSFCDSNGDGIGDLDGIISKLDYIKDLGVETVWFSPIFKSPQKDFGYDISDYRDIAPEYGTLETCEKLIKEMHDRDLKIVLDMVLNHTSGEHPWFLESKSSKDNPKRDWYIWRDGKKPNGKKPPTNWNAVTSGNGWHYDPATEQWFWSQFLDVQPDLNYRNPDVKAEMLDTIRFWLKKGVDGFRLDMISSIFEDAEFRDNPRSRHLLPSDKEMGMLFQKPLFTLDHPDTLVFMKELRSVIDEFDPPRFMVGEVSGPLPVLKKYLGENDDGLNFAFVFQTLTVPFNAPKIKTLIKSIERVFTDPALPTWVSSNHDRMRRISRLDGNMQKAKLDMALHLTARGVPFFYYGEEIGMEQAKFHVKNTLDVVAKTFNKKLSPGFVQFINNIAKSAIKESINRDECRTPMQWNASDNAGFCPAGVQPWLPVTKSFKERNVEAEINDPNSLLSCYKRFFKTRQATPALHSGSMEILDTGNAPETLLMYARRAQVEEGLQEAIVMLNFSDKPAKILNSLDEAQVLVSTKADYEPIHGNLIVLSPWEGLVIIKL